MSVTLKAIRATLNPDGSLDLDYPVSIPEPVEVIVTIAVEEKIPNAVTKAAMEKTGLNIRKECDK